MNKLRKIVMVFGAMLASSMAFVSCSDDEALPKGTLGASYIQAITAHANSVDLQWTITPTANVAGYSLQIFEGTIGNMGSTPVASGTFTKKVYSSSFEGLQPNTNYVVVSKCIPEEGSGFTDADVAYFEFWTAPLVEPTSATAVLTAMTSGDEPVVDEETGEQLYTAELTINWSPSGLTIQNIASLYIYIENSNEDQLYYSLFNPAGWSTFPTTTTVTLSNVKAGEEIMIEVWPNPSNYCWYTTASAPDGILYYTLPQAN